VHKNNELLEKNITRLSPAAEAVLANYEYPGNVRELENIIEHAMVLADTGEITEKDLPEFMFKNRLLLEAPHKPFGGTPGITAGTITTLEDMERVYIRQALEAMQYNYSQTAKKLGISRSTLWRKIKEYKLEAQAPQNAETKPA
jgi:transcriptional regulator with PAS, ATPase and Fis domain